jgi:hypothetical protein
MHRNYFNGFYFHMSYGSFGVFQVLSFKGLLTVFPWGLGRNEKDQVFALPGGIPNSTLAQNHQSKVGLGTYL